MPLPSTMADLSATASLNSPSGTDNISSGDDYIRSVQAIVKADRSTGASLTAASTITPDGAGQYYVVSGSTTITAIGSTNSWNGRIVTLEFSGAPLITHNGTSLILPGAANIQAAAGDVATFVQESSGNWRCTKYQSAAVAPHSATLTGITSINSHGIPGVNKIIGGDFTANPWQRAVTFTAPATGAYTADRFKVTHSSDGVVDIIKTADAPTAAEAGYYTAHCLHADVTTADATIAAGQYYYISQSIEGLNAAALGFGQTGTRYVTLSFWHKHTKTGTYCVSLRNSAANRSYVAEYTQAITDTWEKATITIAVDTSGTWLYDTGIGLTVSFAIAAGSTYQTTVNTWAAGNYLATASQVNGLDSTSNNFKIALVQLEAGQTASTFTLAGGTMGGEDYLCRRYYERIGGESGGSAVCVVWGAGATGAYALTTTVYYKAPKRLAPNITKAGTWGVINCGQPSVGAAGTTSCYLQMTASGAGQTQVNTVDSTTYIEVEKEL